MCGERTVKQGNQMKLNLALNLEYLTQISNQHSWMDQKHGEWLTSKTITNKLQAFITGACAEDMD